MKILLNILFVIFLVVILTTACRVKNSDSDIKNYHIETSDFLMTISTPLNINAGETFYAEGILKYIGTSTVTLEYAKPILQFIVKNEEGEVAISKAYFPASYATQVDPGTEFKVKNDLLITEKGKYELIAITTTLKINGSLINGIGNEKDIKELEEEKGKQLDTTIKYMNSKLTHSILIDVE